MAGLAPLRPRAAAGPRLRAGASGRACGAGSAAAAPEAFPGLLAVSQLLESMGDAVVLGDASLCVSGAPPPQATLLLRLARVAHQSGRAWSNCSRASRLVESMFDAAALVEAWPCAARGSPLRAALLPRPARAADQRGRAERNLPRVPVQLASIGEPPRWSW